MVRLIDADALIENIVETAKDLRTLSTKTIGEAIHKTPTVDAVPLTKEEIKTIRIHINAIKEKLCNQHRYKEAEDYQQIVDKLDKMMDAERAEE